MEAVDPARALEAMVERARAALSGSTADAPTGPFVGEAADGLVRAEAGAEGNVRSLTIDPKLLRRPLEDISAHVVTAVNAALDARPQRAESAPLLAELRAVQEQSVQEMAKISQAFTDALARAQVK